MLPGLAALQDRLEDQGWLLRGQATFILQGHPAFRSPYRGEASLSPAANARNTLSTDLIIGRRLWHG
ncbi:MAG TPA: carbohydrate porin, partial [Vicinamibacteria bacterium]|nr:carbohydrate porin [Vicinamibacteria bacterium]